MDVSPINRCRGCHADPGRLHEVLRLDPMPLAGAFCRTAAEALAAPLLPLTWMECAACGLVQVLEDVPDSLLFSTYNYASSTVPGLVRHFEDYAGLLGRHHGADPLTVLEIGCNDGVLLRRLPASWRRIGVDPSDVAFEAARGADYELIHRPFSTEAVEAAGLAGKVDVISGSNCLAHVSDLRAIFLAAAVALRVGGEFWIEVHDLDALLEGAQWDTIYHEHKAEWSEAALGSCVSACGFQWRETTRIPMHGGAIRVRFQRVSGPTPAPSCPGPQRGLDRLRRAYANRHGVPTVRRLLELQSQGQTIAAYGAAGRAKVYLAQIPELEFAYIVDESPLRIGRFIPRSATPIVPPGQLVAQPPAACLVTAWNYRDDIIRKTTQWKGEWLTAFPAE